MSSVLVRRALLAVLMVGTLATTYIAGTRRHLDDAVPERFRYYGIPVAVSAERYGLGGYVAYSPIAARFFNDKPIDVILSTDLPGALDDSVIANGRRGLGLFFVPADDKGDVTFSRIAFRLFGTHATSLYRAYFTLLLLSVAAFTVVFWADLVRLLVGVCVMLASLSLVSAFQNGLLLPDVVTFYDPRIYGIVAVLAVLHLGFSCVDGQRLSPLRLVCAIYQVFMIVLAVHVRVDNLWLIAAMAVWVVGDAVWTRSMRTGVGSLRHGWPLAVMTVGFAALLLGERLAYHPRYFSTHMAHHLLWHNVGIGLALHPDFAKGFDYQASGAHRVDEDGDRVMMKAVAQYLMANGQRETVTRIFGSAYSNSTGTVDGVAIDVGQFLHTAGSDIALYNDEAQRFVLDTMRAHPRQTAKLFLWYKPRSIVGHYLWFLGATASAPTLDAAGYPNPLFSSGGDTAKTTGRASFAPMRWLGLAVFALALIAAAPAPPARLRGALAASILLLAFSVVPLLVAYAAPFLMGAPLFTLTLTLHLATAVAVSATWRSSMAAFRTGARRSWQAALASAKIACVAVV